MIVVSLAVSNNLTGEVIVLKGKTLCDDDIFE